MTCFTGGKFTTGQERAGTWYPYVALLWHRGWSIVQSATALRREIVVQDFQAVDARNRHQVVASNETDQVLDLALVVALAGTTEAVLGQVVGLVDEGSSQKARALCERASSTTEDPGALSCAVAQDPRHRQRGVVIQD